jgi:uncharacterized membrane protein
MRWTGWLHLSLAMAGLLSGLVVALTTKGTRAHRRWGWAYAISMLGVNLSALVIYRLLGHFGPFHVAALFSLMTVILGMVPVRRRGSRWWLRQHAYWMSGSYVGLWAAAVAETTTRTSVLPFWWMVLACTLAVTALGFWLITTRVPLAIERLKPMRRT